MIVSVEKNKTIVQCTFDEKEIVKAIGEYKFNKARKVWEFPLRKLVNIIDTLNVQHGHDVQEVYTRLKSEQKAFEDRVRLASEIKQTEIISNVPKDWEICLPHQRKALSLASMFDSYALFMDVGSGKSLTTLKLIEFRQVPVLIVAPLSILNSVWMQEIEKWQPKRCRMIGGKLDKSSTMTAVNLWEDYREWEKPYDIYIVNYEGFKKIHNLAKKHEMTPIEAKVRMIVIDESSKLRSPTSQITKALLAYADKIPHKLILSGRPAPNSMLEYWAQTRFINEELLGENFFRFRNTYFYGSGYGGYQYVPYSDAIPKIMDRVSKQAFFIKKEDCLDLPEQTFMIRQVQMDETQRKAYDEMKKLNIMEFKEHTTLAASELAKIMKLRQITAGFTITTEQQHLKISNTKANELIEVMNELDPDRQVIIWVQFHYEVHMLAALFEKNGISYATLYGDMKQRDKDKAIETFQNGGVQCLIAHPKSGGMGLTFVNCSYVVWFSISYSDEEFYQANARIHRHGQKNACTYILLLARDSIDEVIYKALQKKERLVEICLNMLKKGIL